MGFFRRFIGLEKKKSDEELAGEKLNQLLQTDEGKQMLRDQAREIIEENEKKRKEEERKAEEERLQKVEEAKESIETLSDHMAESTEPFVLIRSLEFNPQKGIEIDVDWNDALIRYLRNAGVPGNTDEEVIKNWLGALYSDLELTEQAMDYVNSTEDPSDNPNMDFAALLQRVQEEEEDSEDGYY